MVAFHDQGKQTICGRLTKKHRERRHIRFHPTLTCRAPAATVAACSRHQSSECVCLRVQHALNKAAAEAMLISASILRLGTSKAVAHGIDDDSRDRIVASLKVRLRPLRGPARRLSMTDYTIQPAVNTHTDAKLALSCVSDLCLATVWQAQASGF